MKYILFFCLPIHRLAVRISLPFYILNKIVVIVLAPPQLWDLAPLNGLSLRTEKYDRWLKWTRGTYEMSRHTLAYFVFIQIACHHMMKTVMNQWYLRLCSTDSALRRHDMLSCQDVNNYLTCDSPLQEEEQLRSRLQKSRQCSRSYVWTEPLSGMVFVPAQKVSDIVWIELQSYC